MFRNLISKTAAAVFVAISLVACELPPVYIPVESETVVESNVLVSTINQLGFDQFTNFDLTNTAEFKNGVGSLDKVAGIYIDQFTLSAVEPENGTIDFISSGYFELTADGYADVLFAEIPYAPAEGAKSIDLKVYSDTNLKSIIASKSFTLNSEIQATTPDVDTTVNAKLVFRIQLN